MRKYYQNFHYPEIIYILMLTNTYKKTVCDCMCGHKIINKLAHTVHAVSWSIFFIQVIQGKKSKKSIFKRTLFWT